MRDRLCRASNHQLWIHGIHCDFEWAAYHFLNSTEKQLSIAFWQIRLFSLFLGPDVRWVLGTFPASWSRYNPSLKAGRLPDTISQTLQEMRIQMSSTGCHLKPSVGLLAHLAVDACDPAHHAGKPGSQVAWIGVIPVKTDWEDPYTGSLRDSNEKHNHLERELSRQVRKYKSLSELSEEVQPLYSIYLASITGKVGVKLTTIKLIQEIHNQGIWNSYVDHGWSPGLTHQVLHWLFPRTIAFLAALWSAGVDSVNVHS
jgi:hypothetical protein